MGINSAATVNTSFGAPKTAKAPADFMPSRLKAKPPKQKRFNQRKFADAVRAALLPFCKTARPISGIEAEKAPE